MACFQWIISQQDNYKGMSNLVNEFIADLYLNFDTSSFCYIIHDKETDLHVHCILVLNVALTKKQLLEVFPYSDIRVQKADNKNAWLYLTHNTRKCIEEGKVKYDKNKIVYFNFDNFNEWLEVEKINSSNLKDNQLLDKIVDDILNGELTCYREVLIKYKGIAVKYSRSIQDLFDIYHL